MPMVQVNYNFGITFKGRTWIPRLGYTRAVIAISSSRDHQLMSFSVFRFVFAREQARVQREAVKISHIFGIYSDRPGLLFLCDVKQQTKPFRGGKSCFAINAHSFVHVIWKVFVRLRGCTLPVRSRGTLSRPHLRITEAITIDWYWLTLILSKAVAESKGKE